MTGSSLLMEIKDNPVGFQNNNAVAQKDWDMQSYIKVSLFVSQWEVKIQLVSSVIDAFKVVCSLVENDKDICENVSSKTKTKTVIKGLSLCFNEPIYLFAPKPIQPTKDIFSHYENSYEICFQDCDEYAAGEVYDRLLYAMSNIYDFIVANIILTNIKELVQNINPLFTTAKMARLQGCENPAFEEQSVITLSDVCRMETWSVSISVAKGIFDSLDKQIRRLVVPNVAIDSLISDFSEREKYIFVNRHLKTAKTLEELGSELGLTRERVRQIDAKLERKLQASHSKLDLIKALFFSLKVLCECEYCFTIDELKKYEVPEETLIFLAEVLGNEYTLFHISETDCIALCGKDAAKCEWLECINKVSDEIPAMLLPDEQKGIIKELSASLEELGYSIPNGIIAAIAFRKYVKNGTALVKKSLRLGDRYEIVLEKFFPDGIRLYQTDDMELFRKGYDSLFDDDKISDNDHAVRARVSDRCVLIDRGTYILNKKTKLPTELTQRILDFILQYPFDMVMTNAIMHKFNFELKSIGVDNKYYLLSVLKQYFSDKFSFRRDYVIKGENTGNFYGNITDYVESIPEGISFHELQTHFQGIPDAVLYFALSEDDSIIPMYNKMYIHKSNIIFPKQLQVLSFVQDLVSKEQIVSDERVFGLLKRDYPDFIANNNIGTSWFLFSVLRSFFREKFNFSRPHIIDPAFDSANGREALKSSFWGKKHVEIADIKKYAKEKQIQIYDLSKLLDSYSDRYFILNKEQLISIEEIGYSPDEFFQVEDIVIESLGDLNYAEIAKLNMINDFSRANVTLTDWLIYSIINKYGTRLSAATSTAQFMSSTPLVVRNGNDIEAIREDFASSCASVQTVKIDDLSDIDCLVEGIIDFDFVWGEGKR